jgi:Domain of unknown function (DUF4943)
MKTRFFALLILLSLPGCVTDNWINPDVDQFVTMLKKGTYDSMFIPNFRPVEIDRLLYYANDFQKIKSFPINTISSYMPDEFRLGECILWTIESVRLKYDKTNGFERFPSSAPQLIIPGGTITAKIASLDDLNRAYNLYSTWWSDNKTREFADFRSINPLINAGLMWR